MLADPKNSYSLQAKLQNPHFYLWALLIMGLAWRIIFWGLDFPQGGDETFVALSVMTKDFGGMLNGLEYGQIVPVGFMWLELALTKMFGYSGLILRLIPALGLIAALIIFWRLCLRLLLPWEACLTVGLFATSSSLAQAQMKPYALDILSATALFWAVVRVKEDLRSGRSWLILTVIAALSVWVSYPAVFVSGGLALFLGGYGLKKKEGSFLLFLVLYSLILGLSFGLMFFLGAKAQTGNSDWLWKFKIWEEAYPPLEELWRLPWWLIKTHLGFMFSLIRVDNYGLAVPTACLAWIGFAALIKDHRSPLDWLTLTPLVPALLAAGLKLYPYGGSIRTMLYMAPFFCFLAGYGFSSLYRFLFKEGNKAFLITCLVMLLITGHSILGDMTEPYNRPSHEKARLVFTQLGRGSASDDQWIIYGLTGPAPLAKDSITVSYEPCFRANILTYLKGNILWNPNPETVLQNRIGETRVLVSRDRQLGDINVNQFFTFLEQLKEHQGPYTHKVFILDGSPDNFWSVDLFTFPLQKNRRLR
jgi:hypothetical protein